MENHGVIFLSAMRILKSLTWILLRNGVSYSAFAVMAKKAFVNVVMEDFAIQNRKQSISRISILTGLHRKDVKAIQQSVVAGGDIPLDEKGNGAARVISGWRIDPQFLDDQGQPARLPLKGDGATFETLVKRVSGNMPARAVLDELERVYAEGQLLGTGDTVVHSNLYIGQVVQVKGVIAAGGIGTADRIYYDKILEGPVQSVEDLDPYTWWIWGAMNIKRAW